MSEQAEPEIIIPPARDRTLDRQTQQQIECLQQHSIVGLEVVQQVHA